MKTAKPAVKTIRFQDHGQDFLEWDLAADGQVVDCRPCQAWMWCRARVTNAASLRKGSIVKYSMPGVDASDIRYPLVSVRKAGVHHAQRETTS